MEKHSCHSQRPHHCHHCQEDQSKEICKILPFRRSHSSGLHQAVEAAFSSEKQMKRSSSLSEADLVIQVYFKDSHDFN